VAHLPIQQSLGDHPEHVAAGLESGIGHDAHQAD